jgi:hypothetical protein
MTTAVLIALLLVQDRPPPAASPARDADLAAERTRWVEELRAKWRASRERAMAVYEAARKQVEKIEKETKEAPVDERAEALQRLRQSREDFVDVALAAYVLATPQDRKRIRTALDVRVARGQPWKDLLASLEASVAEGASDPKELLDLFDATREKVAFVRAITRPANRVLLEELLGELKKRYPKKYPNVRPDQSGLYDFRATFELLRELDAASFKSVAQETIARISKADPEAPLVHERMVVVVFPADGVDAKAAAGFHEAFGAWMKAASPDGDARQLMYRGWSRAQIDELMEATRGILDERKQPMPRCPEAGEPSNRGVERAAILCPPGYAGVVAVELRPRGDRIEAFASWRIRERGPEVTRKDRFPDPEEGFAFDRPVNESEGRLRGDGFALEVLMKGTVFKRISATLNYLAKLDPKLRAESFPPAPPLPCPEVPCPVLTSQTVSPWTSALFAGTPFIVDRRADKLRTLIPSALDVGFTIAAGVYLGYAVHNRNRYASGDYNSARPANQALGRSAIMLGGVALTRIATGIYYWAWSGGVDKAERARIARAP